MMSTGLLRQCKVLECRRLYSRSRSYVWQRPSLLLSHLPKAWLAQELPLKLLESCFRLRRSPSQQPALRGLTRLRNQRLPKFNLRVASAHPCLKFHLQLPPPFLLLQTLLVQVLGFKRPTQNLDLSLTYDSGFLEGFVGFLRGFEEFWTLQIASQASQEEFIQIGFMAATFDQVATCDPAML